VPEIVVPLLRTATRASLCQTLEEKGPRMPPPRVDPTREICRDRSFAILEAVCSSEILCRNDILHLSFSKRRSNILQLLIYFRMPRIAFFCRQQRSGKCLRHENLF
jgi:hypothetical protein